MDTDEELQLEAGVPCGHLNRFLYRALKFSEQYKWFSLSDDLGAKVTQFKAYLESGFFTNNIGRNAAGTKRKAESIQEARFSNAGILKNTLPPDIAFGSNEVHRQLSVGLFEGQRAARGKNVFTGGTSAIDLWSWNGDTLEIIELKAGQKKVGIITEIFFYCNYMRDLALPDGTFQLCKEIPKNKDTRGYEDLLSNKFSRVLGILLADAFHPCLGDTAIRIMNSNAGAPIQYYMAKYSAE